MSLKARIKNVEYDVVQGATFSEEYNETLDSGSIIIDHVEKIKDLKPYDDVYIYNGEWKGVNIAPIRDVNIYTEYNGTLTTDENNIKILLTISGTLKDIIEEYGIDNIATSIKMRNSYRTDTSSTDSVEEDVEYKFTAYNEENKTVLLNSTQTYYKNTTIFIPPTLLFLYDSSTNVFTCSIVNANTIMSRFIKFNLTFKPSPIEYDFYKHMLIDDFTEEMLNFEGKTKCFKYKISLMSETKGLEGIPLPNISITEPIDISNKISVYDYLERYVKLYSLKIKVQDDAKYHTWSYKQKYWIDESLKDIFGNCYSPDFTLNNPNLKDLISQLMLTKDMIPYVIDNVIYGLDITQRNGSFVFDKNSISYVVGSRSSENHCDGLKRTYSNALSQENTCRMVEYMGFRNSDNALMTLENMRIETRFPIYKVNKVYMCYYKRVAVTQNSTTTNKMFLCKQDISKLVKLNSERNLLSQDWDKWGDEKPNTIDELAEYKLATVGYDIGSNYISGWGTKYSYPKGWWTIEKTYIENILKLIDDYTPYGIYTSGYVARELGENCTVAQISGDVFDRILTPFTDDSLKMKAVFFQVEYEAFYNGTIVHSKDDGDDNVIINDNSSSSLTLLEQDGIFQKEKVNRFGNKALQIASRYTSLNEMQKLGSVYEYDNDEDVIIYHREYSIYNNMIQCCYYGTKDYVLKNYFTSVYAKHRPYNLMSYAESISRSENKKMYLLMSKENCYYEEENKQILFSNFDNSHLNLLFSVFNPSDEPLSIGDFQTPNKANYGYITYDDKVYGSDMNAFSSGNSICFNISMFDNVSMGVYVSTPSPVYNDITSKLPSSVTWSNILKYAFALDVENDYTGSVQDYHITANEETGLAKTMGFYIAHLDQSELFADKVEDYTSSQINEVYNKLWNMPLLTTSGVESNTIGNVFDVYKDNKEKIDMTYQIEYITDSNDIAIGDYFTKLNDLLGNFNKYEQDVIVSGVGSYTDKIEVYSSTIHGESSGDDSPFILFNLSETLASNIKTNTPCDLTLSWTRNLAGIDERLWGGDCVYFVIHFYKIKSISADEIVMIGTQSVKIDKKLATGKNTYTNRDIEYTLKRTSSVFNESVESGYRFYSNGNAWSSLGVYGWLSYNSTYYTSSGSAKTLNYECGNGYSIQSSSTNGFSGNSIQNDMLISLNNDESHTYKKNYFVVISDEEIKKDLVYNKYALLTDFVNSKYIDIATDDLVSDYFNVVVNEDEMPYINVKGVSKSTQLWYFDENQNCFNFVYGVNTSSSEEKVYISSLSLKDKRVYDSNCNLVGSIANYTENDLDYGKNQFYDI